MKIAELFVDLGIKGSEKTIGAVVNVKKGMGEARSMAIETKVAILGVVYGLEQLMAQSAAVGTNLTNFAAMTGLSTTQLQQWEYATIQAGGSAAELDNSVKNIQKSMAMIDLNKGLPEGLALLSQAAGGIDFSKKDDPFYMMKAFEKGIKNLGDSPRAKAVANYLANTLGLSENIIAGMRRGKFSDDNFKKAPTYNANELAQLDKANIAWANLGRKVEFAFGHFTAAHGSQLVNDLSHLTNSVVKLANALVTVSEKFHVFDKIDKVTDFVAAALDSKPGTVLGETHLEKKAWDWLTGIPKSLGAGSQGNDVDIKQTVIFQSPVDAPKKTADALKKQVGDFVKQNPAKVQGS